MPSAPLHLTTSLCSGAFPIGRRLQEVAAIAERAGFAAAWLGWPPVGADFRLDPLPVLGSLIGVTQRLGLGAHWAVDTAEPFHIARVFATLDHLSGGRTAWIVGLGDPAAFAPQNGHIPTLDAEHYRRRAAEMIDVVRALWDSWEDEGLALEIATGRFADPDRVHPIDHQGEFFTVRGPLNVPRPVQGKPLIVHALPTEPGLRALALATADVLLADLQQPGEGRALRDAIRAVGRNPDRVRVLVNLTPLLGGTEAEAQAKSRELDAMAPCAPTCLRFVGTPEQLASLWADWRNEAGCDGFNLLPAIQPDDLASLAATVLPLARQHGLLAPDEAGPTLRERFALTRPRSRFAL